MQASRAGFSSDAPSSFRSSAIRPGALTLITAAIRESISRRRLIGYLVRAEVRKQGNDTVLGNVWWILDPLLSSLIYVIVMTYIFERRTPDFPLFLLSAMIPFKWFTSTVGRSTSSVIGGGSLIKQIQFPKIVLPLKTCGAELVGLGFGMLVLVGVMVIGYRDHISLMLLWVPVIAFVEFWLILGLALVVSAVTVFYRDIGNLISHIMRLFFYMAPILWSFDDITSGRGGSLEKAIGHTGFQLLQYNPVAILLEQFRHVIYGVVDPAAPGGWSPPVPPDLVLLSAVLGMSLAICAVGAYIFKRLEPTFAKVL